MAQSDRAAATEIVVTALRAVRMDSACARCHVVVVDTVIQGVGVEAMDWAYSAALRALNTPARRYVGSTNQSGGWPGGPRDSLFVRLVFRPTALTMADSGEVLVEINTPSEYGWDIVVSVQRRDGKWRALHTAYGRGVK
jgi:hypothetical protein